MVVEWFRSNQALKWPTQVQPQKPQGSAAVQSSCFFGSNSTWAQQGDFPGSWLARAEGTMKNGAPSVSCACGPPAYAVGRERQDGAHPIQPSAARAPWPFFADESGFQSGAGARRERVYRPVEIALAGPSLRRLQGDGRRATTPPYHATAVAFKHSNFMGFA